MAADVASDGAGGPGSRSVLAIERRALGRDGRALRKVEIVYRDGCFAREGIDDGEDGKPFRDREAGCVEPMLATAMFARADALATGPGFAVVDDANSAGLHDPQAVLAGADVVLVLASGGRLVPQDDKTAEEVEQSWQSHPLVAWDPRHAEPPPHAGLGPQLLVLASRRGEHQLQATVVSNGRWWCRSVEPLTDAIEPALPVMRPMPLAGDQAGRILVEMLADVEPGSIQAGAAPQLGTPSGTVQLETAIGDGRRSGIVSLRYATDVLQRFAAAMGSRSSACIP